LSVPLKYLFDKAALPALPITSFRLIYEGRQMGLQRRGRLIDGESILPHRDGMTNYSLIIEQEETSPSID